MKEETCQNCCGEGSKICSGDCLRTGPPDVRPTILEEADKITSGSRQADYGNPEDCFQKIAEFWNSYLGIKTIGKTDVSMMMVLLKVARESNYHKRDNLVDIAGYARCAEMGRNAKD